MPLEKPTEVEADTPAPESQVEGFTLSPDEYAEKLESIKLEAASLTSPFAECTM